MTICDISEFELVKVKYALFFIHISVSCGILSPHLTSRLKEASLYSFNNS